MAMLVTKYYIKIESMHHMYYFDIAFDPFILLNPSDQQINMQDNATYNEIDMNTPFLHTKFEAGRSTSSYLLLTASEEVILGEHKLSVPSKEGPHHTESRLPMDIH